MAGPNILHFRLFACCIPVTGASRSIICDLQKREYLSVPTELCNDFDSIFKGDLKKDPNHIYTETGLRLIDYINILVEKEYGFWTKHGDDEVFPKLDLKWESPSIITNAIIDIDENSNYDIGGIFLELEELGCKSIQIRIFHVITLEEIRKIVVLFENLRIKSIDLVLQYTEELTLKTLNALCKEFPRIRVMIISNSPKSYSKKLGLYDMGNALYVTQRISTASHCGFISPEYFNINITLFTEAQKFNSCLNRKISVDVQGEIRNCPALKESFGNITSTSLHSAISHAGFKALWEINKDQVDVCKVCEFRYICTDCRAFITDSSNIRSKPAKCNYNPYSGQWENDYAKEIGSVS